MDILKIHVGGFKNIADTTITLADLTALVSLNSYGKSNLLTAIDFGFDFIVANPKQKAQMMRFQAGVPLNNNNSMQNYFFEFEAETILNGQSHIINYCYEFQWRAKGRELAKIVFEQLRIKKIEKNQRYERLIFRDDKSAVYKSSPTGRCATKTTIDGNELVLNKLGAFDYLFFLNLIKQLNSLTVYIDHHLDVSMSYRPDFLIRTDLDELDLSGIQNIPRTIFYLKQEYPEKYEMLKDAYLQLFPDFADFDVDEISMSKMKVKIKIASIESDNNLPEDSSDYDVCNNIYDIKVKDTALTHPISFERLSDGAKRMFFMLTFAVIADIKGLAMIAFEEPENSIHPSLMQSFLLVITQLTENCKIIITSHSPYMLQYIPANNIYIGMPNKKHLAAFRRVLNSKVPVLLRDVHDMDLSVGDYIFELMSGYEDDIEQLNKYLEPEYE